MAAAKTPVYNAVLVWWGTPCEAAPCEAAPSEAGRPCGGSEGGESVSEGRDFEIGPSDVLSLWVAALDDEEELAEDLERLGSLDGADAAEDAAAPRPALLAESERAWNGK